MASTDTIDVADFDQSNAAIAEVDAIGRRGSLQLGDCTIALTADIRLTATDDLDALNPASGVSLTIDGRARDGIAYTIGGSEVQRRFFVAAGSRVPLSGVAFSKDPAQGGSGSTGGFGSGGGDGAAGARTVTGGAAGDGSTPDAGQMHGDGTFVQGDQTVTLAPSPGQILTISGEIADQGGSGGSGRSTLLSKGGGGVVLRAPDTFTGGTTVQAGTLDLVVLGAAGTGPTTFPGSSTTAQIDAAALAGRTYAGAIAGFASGNTIDPTDLACRAGAMVAFADGAITVTSGDDRRTLGDVGLRAGLTPEYFTLETAQDAGTETAVTLTLNVPSAPRLAAGQDTGASATDGVTDIARPIFSGIADPDTAVTLLVDGVADGTGVAGANSAYAVTAATVIADGSHVGTAQAADGDVSAASVATGITIDTVAPVVSSPMLTVAENAGATPIGIATPSDGQTAAANLAITAQVLPSDSTVTLADGTTAVRAGMALTVAQLTGLAFMPTPGVSSRSSTFSYSVVNRAGNAATGTATLDIAAAAPPPRPVPSPAPAPSAVASTHPVPADAVSISRQVSYDIGIFSLSGWRQAPQASPSSRSRRWSMIAMETDAAGGTAVSADPLFSLTGGLHRGGFRSCQTTYTPDGMTETLTSLFHPGGSRHIEVVAVGLTLWSEVFDRFDNHGAPRDTFVFDSGHGLDGISLFRLDDVDHDTLNFEGSDFGYSIAGVLQNTSD